MRQFTRPILRTRAILRLQEVVEDYSMSVFDSSLATMALTAALASLFASFFMLIGAKIAAIRSAPFGRSIVAALGCGFATWIISYIFWHIQGVGTRTNRYVLTLLTFKLHSPPTVKRYVASISFFAKNRSSLELISFLISFDDCPDLSPMNVEEGRSELCPRRLLSTSLRPALASSSFISSYTDEGA